VSKPIVDGCRAVVIVGNGEGSIITIGKFYGQHKNFKQYTRCWTVVGMPMVIDESHMRRIDDYDGNEKTTWDSMTGLWTPETTAA